jgi:hypothetical protein
MTTRLYVALHGGANYSSPTMACEFKSLREALVEWDSRARSGYSFKHLDRESGEWVFCPCWGDPAWCANNDGRYHAGMAWYVDDDHPGVSDGPVGKLFDSTDEYPDRELTVGPRGGLRWERC